MSAKHSVAAGLIAAAVVAVVGVSSGARAAPARSSGNSATYTDSTGEDAAAPDITTVKVSSTDAGLITFRINMPNRPKLTTDMWVQVRVDSDNNVATGDSKGDEYLIDARPLPGGGGGIVVLAVGRWNGSQFSVVSARSLDYSYASGPRSRSAAAISVGRSSLDSGWPLPRATPRPRRRIRTGLRTRAPTATASGRPRRSRRSHHLSRTRGCRERST